MYYYNARWYDPALSHFIMADTIVPYPLTPASWDRYSYVRNNPIRYNDPSGHAEPCENGDECKHHFSKKLSVGDYVNLLKDVYETTLDRPNDWNIDQVKTVFRAFASLEKGLNRITGGKARDWISKNIMGTHFTLYNLFGGNASFVLGNTVHLAHNFEVIQWENSSDGTTEGMIIHELGHVWDNSAISANASIFGGSYGDHLFSFMGGDPEGFRYKGGVASLPKLNQYPNSKGSSYGNNSSADYFAHTFAGAVLNLKSPPPLAKYWLSVVIDLTK